MISAAVFLLVGGYFLLSLFKGIFALIGHDFGKEGVTGKAVIKLFRTPLLCFLALIIYIAFILPYITANGYE